MDITPLIKSGQQIIQNYGAGYIQISGQRFETPVLVSPSKSREWTGASSAGDITPQDIDAHEQKLKGKDLFLVGTGTTLELLPAETRSRLKDHGLALEMMDTPAACRTYNILLSEERRFIAALFPV